MVGMDKLDLSQRSLKKFGITMAVAGMVIAALVFFKHRHLPLALVSAAAAFLALGKGSPGSLKPVYIVWMKIAFVLGWINTRILLLAMFYLVCAPIGLVLRLMGKDLLDRSLEPGSPSYWRPCGEKGSKKEDYERQF